MGMFEEMKRTLECAIGEYRINIFRLGMDGMHTVALSQADFNSLWKWEKRLRLWKGSKMEWFILFLMLWIVFTVLITLNGSLYERSLYLIAGALCSGICVMIVFVVWLIARLIV